MSTAFSISLGAAVLCATLAMLLKNLGWRGTPVFVSVAIVGIISLFSDAFMQIFDTVELISSYADISDYAKAALKILGVGYLSGILSDILTELGEAGIAKAVNLCAKLEIVIIVLPYFRKIIETAVGFLG